MSNLAGWDSVAIARHKLGTVEFFRSGAYANLNDIAKPFGKRVDNWTRLKSTKELFEAFRSDPSYGGAEPIRDVLARSEGTGGFVAGGGLYAHPDIAIQFAQWCSPGFSLWVARQIRHLMTYGQVNLHYTEWSEEEHREGIEYNRDEIRNMYGRRKD